MKREPNTLASLQYRHGGAALIIVLAMTGMLMFLGFFFFSYISVERNSAAWFALSANREINDGDYFDFALQQVLIGPTDDLRNSALYGRKWSMIPNMLGSFGPDLKPKDMQPFSGRGVNVRYQGDAAGTGLPTSSQFFFDYNGLGTGPDYTDTTRKIVNFSPAANLLNNPLTNGTVPDFEPDAGYTYPDINSMFLGYFSLIDDPDDPTGPLKKVWIPSFHRPQYLPRSAAGDLYTNPLYRNRILRPHQQALVRLRQYDGSAVQTQNAARYVTAASGGTYHAFTGATGPSAPFPTTAPHSGIWQDKNEWNSIEYEVDADGISANGAEAILLDLDHRVETLADGSKRIPMYAITIMDADGLLNLNVAGNLLGEDQQLAHTGGSPFGNGRFVTQSNMGLSPSELNLGRALYRPLPSSASPDASYTSMFHIAAPLNQTSISNMEVARLLLGAPGTTEPTAGRWGEQELLTDAISGGAPPAPAIPREAWSWTNLFPAPGKAALDDNNNYGTGGGKALLATAYNRDPIFGPLGISIPPGVHPIDPMGTAIRYLVPSQLHSDSFVTAERDRAFLNNTVYTNLASGINNYGKLRMGHKPSSASLDDPNKWLNYTDRWELQADPNYVDAVHARTGVYPWFQGTGTTGTLQSTQSFGKLNYFLADEPDEIVIEPLFRNLQDDALFSVSEMQYLHLNDTDWSNISTTSRLQQLIKFNFERTNFHAATNYDDSWWLRSQFTTDSFDRWEFGFSPAIGVTLNPYTGVPSGPRSWEYTSFNPTNVSGKYVFVFPPEFDGAPRTARDLHPTNPTYRGATDRNDPYRPEVYEWLRVVHDPLKVLTNVPFRQRRLNINRLLERDLDGKIIERHLTPHPVFDAGDMDTNGILDLMYGVNKSVVSLYDRTGFDNNLDPIPSEVAFNKMNGDKFVQEWWAKYDRQRLARDIYVLLYTLGGGDHTKDPTRDPLAHGSDADEHQARCKEMAQFAVNYVDALDRDSVITEFVYDTDLSDGWEITGEKNFNGEFVDSSGETASVFGVETQQLAFSESLWTAFENNQTVDSNKTPWDDASGTDIQFLFVELRNASPFNTNFADGTWRLRRIVGNDDFEGSETDDISAAFSTNAAVTEIEAGANFWIGSHNVNDDQLPAAILGDVDGNSTYEAGDVFCPSRQPQDPTNPGPICQLDLCHSDHSTYFQMGNGSDPGYFLSEAPELPGLGNNFQLVLERRLNPHGNGSLDNDAANPWVPVDYMQVEMNSSVLDIFGGGADIALGELQKATSRERRQPFDSDTTVEHPEETNGRSHTFGPASPLAYNDAVYTPYVDANEATPEIDGAKTYTLWQPHFDRDYTSVYELLSLPLVGPDKLTQKLAEDNRLNGKNTAYTKFAFPIFGDGTTHAEHTNNWYRVLELLEVPTSVHSGIKDLLPIPRTPGKINLNTIRHPGVLAALIDDDYHLERFENLATAMGERYSHAQLQDPHEANRNWYEQFLSSRDRIDPVTDLPLPGIPGARPFRPLSFVDTTTSNPNAFASVEHTLLRSLPYDAGWTLMAESNNTKGLPGATGWTPPMELNDSLTEVLSRRGLFEARTNLDAGFMGSPVDAVDFHTRTRLLNKIANNTTVRSNVFYCWIEVRFHEAAEDEFGNAQVGGPLDTSVHAPKRAFFVLDRSKLEEAWDPRTRSFDWRKFVTFRKVL